LLISSSTQGGDFFIPKKGGENNMSTQLRPELVRSADNRNGESTSVSEDPFSRWLKTFKAANLDKEGRTQPSDLSVLKQRVLELRGAIPLSGPINTEISVVRPTKVGEPPVVTTEPRVGRVEARPVGEGLARDIQLVLALRRPEDDYRAEPTRAFDPLTAAQESLRAKRVEIVPLESGDLSQVDKVVKSGVLDGINSQVGTIESQARAYLAWAQ
jgi:hypothetical protein